MTKANGRPSRTNEQMIRGLKGEKLAVFLDKHNFCPQTPIGCEETFCRVCIRQWLKEEAEK